MTSFRLRTLAPWLLGLLAAATTLPGMALADATPVELVLLYMPNVSNTGTPTASGIAELVLPEGEVRVTATGLPRLDGDSQYVVWVVNSDTNQFERVGAFNSAETTQAVHYENVLPDAIPNNKWNLLLLTVEDSANADHPSTDHSIAGVFPSAANAPLPGVLPNTGGADPYDVAASSSDWSVVSGLWADATWADRLLASGLVALTFGLGLAAGYGVRRLRPVRVH
jgi:hypothetical protein